MQTLSYIVSIASVQDRVYRIAIMDYHERIYRERFDTEERFFFIVSHKQTDLWIGVDMESYVDSMPNYALRLVTELRDHMDKYLQEDSEYETSLEPYSAAKGAPEIMQLMSKASHSAGIGPMSAVAGAVAQNVAVALKNKFRIKEIIVENGGDIYVESLSDLDVSVFAGGSPLSERVGLRIPANAFPLGICTSSGTVGPSFSFGKADAVMIVCRDVLLADSYATAMANLIQTVEDIPLVIEMIKNKEEILSAIIIKDDKMGVAGKFRLKIFKI